MAYADGIQYEGEWKNGNMNGKGKYIIPKNFSKPGVYEGDMKDGARSGKGTFTYVSGHKYEGEWKNDKPNGKGFITYSNGNKYIGLRSESLAGRGS